MELVAGVDGCRNGWVVVWSRIDGSALNCEVFPSIAEIVKKIPRPGVIAVDIPIGLLSEGKRACEIEARVMLQRGRASSVFTAPLRPVLGIETYEDASAKRREIEGKGMTKQAFCIMPKIVEMDSFLRKNPGDAARVFEVHPEVSFAAMNGLKPLQFGKKKLKGREERLKLLREAFRDAPENAIDQRDRSLAAADDIVDAFCALWTAKRIASGIHRTLPAGASQSGKRIDMAIHF